jgi:hypothetical protein
VVIDRQYPVTWPTIQMSPGKLVYVAMGNPLDFETVSLDLTTFSALPGTDQLASIVTAAIPQLKGFYASQIISPSPGLSVPLAPNLARDLTRFPITPAERQAQERHNLMQTIHDQLAVMQALLDTANAALPDEKTKPELYDHVTAVYEQLNQAAAPLPKPGSGGPKPYQPPPDAQQTPDPWTDYADWRIVLLCELAGGPVDGADCPTGAGPNVAAFFNILGDITALQAQLPTTPPAPAPTNPLFDQATFEGLGKDVKNEIPGLPTQGDKDQVTEALKSLQTSENALLSRLSTLSNTLTNVQKDFVTYYQNILVARHAVPAPGIEWRKRQFSLIGVIYDPRDNKARDNTVSSIYPQFLGRQVAYSVNAVDNIATARTSFITTANKVATTTVTVLYADPIFETSAGAIVSFVHNRSFVNQTIANAPPSGIPYVNGDVVIQQTKTDPELEPIVAAHWRVGDDFLMPDHRRGAVYGTVWAGLNPYTTVPEYGVGPTLAWRSLMFSFLYNRAHQTSLLPGEKQGQLLCGPPPTNGSSPGPCTVTPSAPVTQTTALNAFAIGVTIRIPTSFAAGTGGVSR